MQCTSIKLCFSVLSCTGHLRFGYRKDHILKLLFYRICLDMENENISGAVLDYRNDYSDCEDGNILKDLVNVEQGQAEKRKRIRSEQLTKLKSFTETHTDFTKGTNKPDCVQELAWDCLAVELNSIGPPVHTSKGWRTVWSQYKANKKRKMAIKQLESNKMSSESCLHDITGTLILLVFEFKNKNYISQLNLTV